MNDDLFAIQIDAPISPDGEGCEQYLTWPNIWTGGQWVDMKSTLAIEPATFPSEDEAEKAFDDYEYRAIQNGLDPLPCVIVAV